MDRVRIGTFSIGGRFVSSLDLNDGVILAFQRDAFKVTQPERRQVMSSSNRRYGGAQLAFEAHDNGSIDLGWNIRGGSKDETLARANELITALEDQSSGRFLEWRPEGATYSVYYEIRGASKWEPAYRWITWQGTSTLQLTASISVAPLALGDYYDIEDDFSVNTISDYTFDVAPGTLSVTGGQLVPSSTALKWLRHTARGHKYEDVQATLEYTAGTTMTGSKAGVLLRALDSQNFLFVDAGPTNGLRIGKFDNNSEVILASVGSISETTGNRYWARLRSEGNVLTAEWFTQEPTPMGTPAATVSHTLTGANLTKFGAGIKGDAGIYVTPGDTNYRYDNLKISPYVYKNQTLPRKISLGGAIPGTAPAQADITVTPSGGASAPIWALLGWGPRSVSNKVWNGNFETDTAGWLNSYAGALNTVATLSRVTSDKKFGTAALQVVTTSASAFQGAAFRMFDNFRKGVTYTAEMWVKAASGAGNQVLLSVLNQSSTGVDLAYTLTGTWTKVTTTFTTSSDTFDLGVILRTNAATANTILIDGVQVYEGTVAPTPLTQQEGRGAREPFGVVAAESARSLTTWALTADANYNSGVGLKATTSGAGNSAAEILVDPSLLTADDFTQGEIDVEVWGRFELASTLVTPTVTVSTTPDAGVSFGQQRFTPESSVFGKLITKPSSGTQFRFSRLGTLTMSVDKLRPARWIVRVDGTWGVGSSGQFGFDYLVLVPSRQRAASASNKPNDGTYPKFVASTAETEKRIRSDLSALAALPPAYGHPDHGLGGQQIELPVGNVDLLAKLSSLVADDPTSDATTEQLAHSATVRVSVRPRYWLGRGS